MFGMNNPDMPPAAEMMRLDGIVLVDINSSVLVLNGKKVTRCGVPLPPEPEHEITDKCNGCPFLEMFLEEFDE